MEAIRNKQLSKSRALSISRRLTRLEKQSAEFWRAWNEAFEEWDKLNEDLERFPKLEGDLLARVVNMYGQFGDADCGTPEYIMEKTKT